MKLGDFELNKRMSFARLREALSDKTINVTEFGFCIGNVIFCVGKLEDDHRKHFQTVVVDRFHIKVVSYKIFVEQMNFFRTGVFEVNPLCFDPKNENLLYSNGYFGDSIFLEYFVSRFGSDIKIYSHFKHPVFVVKQGRFFLGFFMGKRNIHNTFVKLSETISCNYSDECLDTYKEMFPSLNSDQEQILKQSFKRQHKEVLVYQLASNNIFFRIEKVSQEVLAEYPDIVDTFS